LSDYLSTTIIKNDNQSIDAPFGFGEVFETGRVDVSKMIEAYIVDLLKKDLLIEESFSYKEVKIESPFVQYKNLSAKNIVFAEGYGIKKNPYFNNLPLVPAKGELLSIHAPDLRINFVLKANIFIIPLGEDLYQVGATYEWKDLSNQITNSAREELLNKLDKLILCPYKVINQVAGIRPTVKDRRPLVGQHVKFKNIFVLNGLGTRGVMIGPYVANKLYNYIENNIPLEQEIDVRRFD
ncbi:MAG: FAD-dependent oxidoreductase, partial [Flaviramulus sp.]